MPKPSYQIIISFIAASILGIALIQKLNVKLMPDRKLPSVSVNCNYTGANALVVDGEVTSKLESIFSGLEGLKKLKSTTSKGNARISLQMDENADMDAVRFEVATKIRQLYPELPQGVSYPQIRVSGLDNEQKAKNLMVLTISGNDKRWVLGQKAEELIKEPLSLIDGINDVQIAGYNPLQWNLEYDINLLKDLDLSASDVSKAIRSYFNTKSLSNIRENSTGNIETSTPVIFKGLEQTLPDWNKIMIPVGDRLFRLNKLVKIYQSESNPYSYYRINGLSTITLRLSCTSLSNQIKVGNDVKNALEKIKSTLPSTFKVDITYDATDSIISEISKIVLRIVLSLSVLLLFVWFVSKSRRYLLVIFLSMLANVLIAFVLYHIFKVEIHIYSLAGITISLGIVIDNTIVMTDHLRMGKGMSVFRGILSATLTTIGALVIVFFLGERQQLMLLDFAYVIIINLAVSLLISLLFIPALLDKFPLPKPSENRKSKTKRRLVRFYNVYEKFINKGFKRFKILFILLAILTFGLPVFKLPGTLEGDKWYTNTYNSVFASDFYIDYVMKPVNYVFGGTLRLFLEETKQGGNSDGSRRTSLNVNVTMYDGTTLEKSNEIVYRVEKYLSQYSELEQFQTYIYGSGSAYIDILFKPEYEFDGFPHTLKAELESLAVEMGVGDWKITGVGRGFDNSLNDGYRNSRVMFYGYNFDQLKEYANTFKSYLENIQRVEENSIFINGRSNRNGRIKREHIINFDDNKLASAGVSKGKLINELRKQSNNEMPVITLNNEGRREEVVLKGNNYLVPDKWQFANKALKVGDEKLARVNYFGKIKKERVSNLINKENMEYTMVVEFNFIGSYGQKEHLIGRVIKKMQDELPIGYRLEQQTFFGGNWSKEEKSYKDLWLLCLVLVIIYGICAVVFESFKQPLVVLATIPISFIGVFLTFYFMDIPFGQGGYASLLLLSGLTVNSALYIINDLNQIRQSSKSKSETKNYIKAIKQKITPILLTISSTVLGLIPFLIHGDKEPFWFSLAVGTMGGLVFSLIAIFVYLPLLLTNVSTTLIVRKKLTK